MNCSDFDELLSAYANGELSRTQREFVEEHLSSCADCRAALVDYTEVRQQLMSLKAAPSMPDLNEATMSRIRAAKYAPLKADGRKGIGSFIPNRLNWKTGLISILALAIVVSLAVTIPLLFRQSTQALAVDIALNSQEVRAALEGKELDEGEVEVIDGAGDIEHTIVVMRVEPDYVVIAEVDMGIKEVVQVNVVELTDENKQEIIDIAKTDPRVQGLLEQGAYISSFQMSYSHPNASGVPNVIVVPDGEVNIEDIEGWLEFIVDMRIVLGEKEYMVLVDLPGERVLNLIDLTQPQ